MPDVARRRRARAGRAGRQPG